MSSIIKNGYSNLLSNPKSSIDDESYIDIINGIQFMHNGKFIKEKYIQNTNQEKTLVEVIEKYTRRLERLHDYTKSIFTHKSYTI